jgi:hypothetical protein
MKQEERIKIIDKPTILNALILEKYPNHIRNPEIPKIKRNNSSIIGKSILVQA